MKRIEIKKNEYKISNIFTNAIFYTENLDDDIAFGMFSKVLEKVSLAREIDGNILPLLMKEFNPSDRIEDGLIQVHIIGGIDSDESRHKVFTLIQLLQKIDNNTNIIDISSYDACEIPHPNSCEINCYHGQMRGM